MIFMIIGVVFGYAAHYYLQCHQKVHVFMRPYNKDYPLVAATIAACITAITVYVIGAYTDTSVGVIALVSDSLTTGKYIEMQAHHTGVKKAGGLIVHGIFRVLLTLMGTNIAVPAGIFMVQLTTTTITIITVNYHNYHHHNYHQPVFLIGGIWGRLVGHLMEAMTGPGVIYLHTYALVGSVAFAAGITHTISVAVIAVELTGDIQMMLPCLVAATIAAGITKSKGISVYDQGMLNKGLESFQLLLTESGGHKTALEITNKSFVTLNKQCTIRMLLVTLEDTANDITRQSVLPIIDINNDDNGNSKGTKKLTGTIAREDLFKFLFLKFNQIRAGAYIKNRLSQDYKLETEREARLRAKERNRARREATMKFMKSTVQTSGGYVDRFVNKCERWLFNEDANTNTNTTSTANSNTNVNNTNATDDAHHNSITSTDPTNNYNVSTDTNTNMNTNTVTDDTSISTNTNDETIDTIHNKKNWYLRPHLYHYFIVITTTTTTTKVP